MRATLTVTTALEALNTLFPAKSIVIVVVPTLIALMLPSESTVAMLSLLER